jgi:hypothetical protein
MPTPLSIGHGLQLRRAQNQSGTHPVVVVIGWMGAKESQLKSYLKFYHEHGFDSVSFAVGPLHVLQPQRAMEYMENVLDITADLSNESVVKSNGGKPRDVVFHCFSMGGYLFGQSLVAMQNSSKKFSSLPTIIKGQIFDSPPDYGSIATGISKSMGLSGALEKSVEKVAQAYLAVTKDTAGLQHRRASAAFHDNYIKAPSLWYFSKADPVSRWEDCETVIGKWRGKGTNVQVCTWEDTPHIQHGRLYPDLYFRTLKTFLQSNKII